MIMMKKKLDRYNFDKISDRMSQKYGTLPKGGEEDYTTLLFPMESNLLKLHREDARRDSRKAIEAIHICLLTVNGYLNDIEYDFGIFLSGENKALAKGLLMGFDPFTNEEIREALKDTYDLDSKEGMEAYFREPVMCLLRLEKSIEMWLRARGNDGYFQYIEDLMGDTVKRDLEMNYAVLAKEEEE